MREFEVISLAIQMAALIIEVLSYLKMRKI